MEREGPFWESEGQELRIFSGTQGPELIQDQKERQFRIEIENDLQRCFVWPVEYFTSGRVMGNILKTGDSTWKPSFFSFPWNREDLPSQVCIFTWGQSVGKLFQGWLRLSAHPGPHISAASFLTAAHPFHLSLQCLSTGNVLFWLWHFQWTDLLYWQDSFSDIRIDKAHASSKLNRKARLLGFFFFNGHIYRGHFY